MRVVSTRCTDTWASSAAPKRSYDGSAILQAEPSKRITYLHFSQPFPQGVRIVAAVLRLRLYARSAATQLEVRPIAQRPFFSQITWEERPTAVTGPGMAATVSTPGATDGGHELVVDVRSQLQAVSDGTIRWRGWQVASLSGLVKIYGAESSGYASSWGPVLEVEWSEAPSAPEDLSPAGGLATMTPRPVLSWDHTDVAGDRTLAAVQVQTSPSGDWSSPSWDSGVVPTTSPQLDLAQTTFPALASGASIVWRARQRDGAGLWSPWSDDATFRYVSPATGLSITSPTGEVIGDTTPPVVASLTGGTMTAYQVIVARVSDPKKRLWDTGRRSGSQVSIEVPAGVIRRDDVRYRITVRAWDDQERVSTAGAPAYYSASVDVLIDKDAGVVPVEWVTATPGDPCPWVDLEWTRDVAADSWIIVRDGVIVATPSLEDTLRADGTYGWRDHSCPARRDVRYVVRPTADGRTGYGNDTVTTRLTVGGKWITTPTEWVVLLDRDGHPELDVKLAEDATATTMVTGRVVVTTLNRRGYEGTVSGDLLDLRGEPEGFPVRSAEEQRDAWRRIRANPRGARLIVGDINVPVALTEMTAAPLPIPGHGYAASATVAQNGELDDLDGSDA